MDYNVSIINIRRRKKQVEKHLPVKPLAEAILISTTGSGGGGSSSALGVRNSAADPSTAIDFAA